MAARADWPVHDIAHTTWVVRPSYTHLNAIGSGAYGLVCSARNTDRRLSEEKVAIKKLSLIFDSVVLAKKAYREIMLLKHVAQFDHENIIKMIDLYTSSDDRTTFDSVFIVTELMSSDLHTAIQTNELSIEQTKFITYQILRGLKFLHSAKIIHRDLKPKNVTINANLDVKIIDFGLSRRENDNMTGYVVTRWYRAPEVLLQWTKYSTAVDMWSVGCILFEMLTSRPLFPAPDYIEHLRLILNLVGFSNEDEIALETPATVKNFLIKFSPPSRVNFQEHFRYIRQPKAVDLMDKLLTLNADMRLTAENALRHDFIPSEYHDSDDEPDCEPYDDTYEDERHVMAEWREKVFDAVQSFHQN